MFGLRVSQFFSWKAIGLRWRLNLKNISNSKYIPKNYIISSSYSKTLVSFPSPSWLYNMNNLGSSKSTFLPPKVSFIEIFQIPAFISQVLEKVGKKAKFQYFEAPHNQKIFEYPPHANHSTTFVKDMPIFQMHSALICTIKQKYRDISNKSIVVDSQRNLQNTVKL